MHTVKNIGSFLKRNLFLFCVIASFILPDAVLRTLHRSSFGNAALMWVPTLFTVFWVALFVLLCVAFMSKKWGRAVYLVFVTIFSVLMISHYIYYRIFNQFFWLDNISMTGQALDYTGYVLGYVDFRLIICVALQVFLITVAFRHWRPMPFSVSGLFLIVPILALVILHTSMTTQPAQSMSSSENADVWSKPQAVYHAFSDANRSMDISGLYQYTLRNLLRIAVPMVEPVDRDTATADTYFAEKPVASDNAMTGLFEGKNVIMVMMESMDDWMLDDTYTPTIRYMQQHGIDFSNHFSCTFGTGYTFNTEFTANTGYHALTAGAPAAALSNNTYSHSLANLFAAKGYTTKSFHFNAPDFYNRGAMHKAFGYSEYVSYLDYMPVADAQRDATAIKSAALYKEMTENDRFFDFVITYSAHLPYSYEDEKLRNIKRDYPSLIDTSMDTEINNAKILAHDTDEYFRILLENLKHDGLLENTVIVAFTDHFSYGISSWEKLYAMGDATTSDMLQKTPFFIYCAGMEGQSVTKVTNSLDILPTVANLFGLGKTPYALGCDAFDNAYPGYVYFSSGSWYDGSLYYFADEHINTYAQARLPYIDTMNALFAKRERINEIVLHSDYFKKE